MYANQFWLKSPRWDIGFLVLSAIIALTPYTAYILFGGNLTDNAETVGTAAYNARVFVNTLVAIFIGGPHMYATFTKTLMDPETFKKKRLLYISTSIMVPIFVFAMAIVSYETYVWLLTIFFGMASIHALHQVIWICGAYDLKTGKRGRLISQAIDYGVVFASLYPIPLWKMVNGDFNIGPVSLAINQIIVGWYPLAMLVTVFFIVMLTLFAGKSYLEWREGTLHYGKTLLITVTVAVMFFMMFLPNTDTAAQGINTWHSFQYLALTWYSHKIAEAKYGKNRRFLHFWKDLYDRAKAMSSSRLGLIKNIAVEFTNAMRKIDGDTGWSSFYMLTLAMLPVSSVIVIATSSLFPQLHTGRPGADEVYTYMGLLSILLIHYVHDALLFVDSEDLVIEGTTPNLAKS